MEQLRPVRGPFRPFARVHVDDVGCDVVVGAWGEGGAAGFGVDVAGFGVVHGLGAGAGAADDGNLGGDDAGERVLV